MRFKRDDFEKCYYSDCNEYKISKFLSFGNETFWELKQMKGNFKKVFRTLKEAKEYLK